MRFSPDEMIAELYREIGQRNHVYPRLVAEGKLNSMKSARQIAILQAIIDDVLTPLATPSLFDEVDDATS